MHCKFNRGEFSNNRLADTNVQRCVSSIIFNRVQFHLVHAEAESSAGTPCPFHFLCPFDGVSWQTDSSSVSQHTMACVAEDRWCCNGFRTLEHPECNHDKDCTWDVERKIDTGYNWTSGTARCFTAGLHCIFPFLFSDCQTNGRILRSEHSNITHTLKLSIQAVCLPDKRNVFPDVTMSFTILFQKLSLPPRTRNEESFKNSPPPGAGGELTINPSLLLRQQFSECKQKAWNKPAKAYQGPIRGSFHPSLRLKVKKDRQQDKSI